MDGATAKIPQGSPDEEVHATRAIAFPDEHAEIHEEKTHHGHLRPKGVEMKREMTKEDKELAAAGYEHLEEHKAKGEKGDAGFDNVDIQEHRYTFDQLIDAVDANVDTKDPGNSFGLSVDDAKARLARDGPNVLTPPKKKSAFRKVSSTVDTATSDTDRLAGSTSTAWRQCSTSC